MHFRASIGLVLWATVLLPPSVGFAATDCGFSPPSSAPEEKKSQYKACQNDYIEKRLGKYFCFVNNMAGIQYPSEGEGDLQRPNLKAGPFIGKIRPHEDKFFIEMSRNPNYEMCKEGAPLRKYCDLSEVFPPFMVKSNSKETNIYGFSSDTFEFHDIGGQFILYGGNSFRWFSTSGSSYIAEGMCEKIN